MIQLSDAPDVHDPLTDGLLEPLDESWVLNSIFKVISRQVASLRLALVVLGFDLVVVNEFDFWHNDILLALNKMHFQFSQMFLDVLEACRC